MSSRRRFLAALGATAPMLPATAAPRTPLTANARSEQVSLNGVWSFRLDPENFGLDGGWYRAGNPAEGWRTVTVPHTWQIEPASAGYMGAGWYCRDFDAPARWEGHAVRVEFEAVFHSAVVWLNGREVGRHTGKGYTAFVCDLQQFLQFGRRNTLVVRADNSFDESMLPRGRSSDWTHDGGIYRPVQLWISPMVFVEGVSVDGEPNLATGEATIDAAVALRNADLAGFRGSAAYQVQAAVLSLSPRLRPWFSEPARETRSGFRSRVSVRPNSGTSTTHTCIAWK